MKITVYVKQHDDDSEEIVGISDPKDMSDYTIDPLDKIKKMQQQSHIIKDKMAEYLQSLLK